MYHFVYNITKYFAKISLLVHHFLFQIFKKLVVYGKEKKALQTAKLKIKLKRDSTDD